MSISDVSYEKSSSINTDSNAPLDGAGGGPMDVWTDDRTTLLRNFIGGGSGVSNNSSFDLPSGVVDDSNNGYENSFENSEVKNGVSAQGIIQASDGTFLSGTVSVTENGETVGEKSTGGRFLLGFKPPDSVTKGSTSLSSTYDLIYSPSIAGIDTKKDDIGLRYDLGTVQYGSVKGTVTDYDGNPVSGSAVFGEGNGTTTSSDGTYEIAAPGGTQIELTALNGTETDKVTPSGGSSVTKDFQFSRIVISVVDPKFNPLQGTAVEIADDNYETDGNGKVVVQRAGIKSYTAVIDGEEEFTVTVSSQGELVEERYGNAFSGYRVTLRENDTQLPIQSTTVTFKAQSIASQTNSNGRASTLTSVEGEKEVELGKGDRRYETKTVTVDVTNGEIKSEKATLSRRSNAPTIS